MKVYTKTGDKGTTSLLGGSRVPKHNPRIEAYGTVDELNAYTGVLRDATNDASIDDELIEIQNLLFTIGSTLAAEPGAAKKFKLPEVTEENILFLERNIDRMDEVLPKMRNFVLPGGHIAVSHAHVARTVCRKAERRVIELAENDEVPEQIQPFLNRLSDYFFVLSRYIAHWNNVDEVPWKPNKQ